MDKLKEKILQSVGHASVCWDKDKVFDTEEANKVADDLYSYIIAEIGEAKREAYKNIQINYRSDEEPYQRCQKFIDEQESEV